MKRTNCVVAQVLLWSLFVSRVATVAQDAESGPLLLRASVPKASIKKAEPLPVLVEVENQSQATVPIVSLFEPVYGFLRFHIVQPDGDEFEYQPISTVSLANLNKTDLSAGDVITHTELLLYSANDGYVFSQTGVYSVVVSFDVYGNGHPLNAKSLSVLVEDPEGIDNEAYSLFYGTDQGRFAAGNSDSVIAKKNFSEISTKYANSRYAGYCEFYLGLYYLEKHSYPEAETMLQRILLEHPDFPLVADVGYRLAKYYVQTGQNNKAIESLAGVIATYPKDVIAQKAKILLTTITPSALGGATGASISGP